jgi:hypothetical protein
MTGGGGGITAYSESAASALVNGASFYIDVVNGSAGNWASRKLVTWRQVA